MSFFALQKIPGLAWPEIPAGQSTQLWSLHLELVRTQWLAPAEILGSQLAQARALLAHCSQHVPYYQEIFRKARVKPTDLRTLEDFRRIPILERRTWQQ